MEIIAKWWPDLSLVLALPPGILIAPQQLSNLNWSHVVAGASVFLHGRFTCRQIKQSTLHSADIYASTQIVKTGEVEDR